MSTKKIETLMSTIASLSTTEETLSFFSDLCSRSELEAMADRWAIAPLLEQGLSYRNIHKMTGISLTTIGRVAQCLQHGANGYKKALQKLANATTMIEEANRASS